MEFVTNFTRIGIWVVKFPAKMGKLGSSMNFEEEKINGFLFLRASQCRGSVRGFGFWQN